MASAPTIDQRVGGLARRQHGLLTHADVRRFGLTDRMVAHRVSSGRWRRLAPGLYVVAGAPDTPRQRLLASCLATGGVASHQSAVALFGIGAFPLLPHVTIAPGRSPRSRLARVHRSDVDQRDRRIVDGIPSVTLARAIVDVAPTLSIPDLAEVVDEAADRELVTAAGIRDASGRCPNHRGEVRLLEVVRVWDDVIVPGSPGEARLLRYLESWGFAGAVPQFEVRDADGRFVARLDVAFPARRVALEYDGRRHHGPRSEERDEARYAAVKALGWRIDGVTKLDLLPGERRLRDLLRRWLG